ncbi:MAG: oligosaccharide flippase family protein [Anaerolineales bacterium]|nr:oligosaccharide flippase family protein [Anaerolineales bacterium]MBP6210674.1 oligosaccharide flippase family protein [Anaerolineales bacterium]
MQSLFAQLIKYKKNRVIRNSFYGFIQFVIPSILLLVTTPILIHRMGADAYGLWMLATTALGLMGIVDFGLSTSISKFVAEFVGSGDTDALSVLVLGGLSVYILLGGGLIIPLYYYAPTFSQIFKPSETISAEQIGQVIRIMSFGFLPLMVRTGALAVPVGLQQFEVLLVGIVYQILSYGVALLVTLWGGSVEQVVIGTVVVLWATALWSLRVAHRSLRVFSLRLHVSHRVKDVWRKVFSFSLMSGISGLGSRIFNYVDRLAVGAVLGLDAVAYYSIIVSVSSKILHLSSSLTGTLMPAVSSWAASGQTHRVRPNFYRAFLLILIMNFLVCIFLLLFSEPLLKLWIGEDFTRKVLLPFRVLVLIYSLISINTPSYFVANGLGLPYLNAISSTLGGLLTVLLIFIFGPYWGLTGVAWANCGYFSTMIQTIGVFYNLQKAGRKLESNNEF